MYILYVHKYTYSGLNSYILIFLSADSIGILFVYTLGSVAIYYNFTTRPPMNWDSVSVHR